MALKQPAFTSPGVPGKPSKPERVFIASNASELERPEKTFAIPLLSRLQVAAQLKLLGVVLIGLILATAVAAFLDNRNAEQNARYVAQSGKLLVLSQRLAKDARQSLSGSPRAFENLARSRESFSSILALLDKGGDGLSATPGDARTVLNDLMPRSTKLLADVRTLEKARPALIALNEAATTIHAKSRELRDLTQHLLDSAQIMQKNRAIRFNLSLERVARDAATVMLAERAADMKSAQTQLKQNLQETEYLLKTFPANDLSIAKITPLLESFRTFASNTGSNTQLLLEARNASTAIVDNSDAISNHIQKLADTYQPATRITRVIMIPIGALVLLVLMLIGKVYLDDSRKRARDAERSYHHDQQAILRLMDELFDLAEGNLKTKATVSEDATSSIADMINFAIEELRKLVVSITSASDRVMNAVRAADDISTGLLAAAQKQSDVLKGAGEAVQQMIKSIQEVGDSAAQSAEVARRTLVATEQGEQAVQNSITGMGGIRSQIQEASNRIKQLGESSQEIGEIVEIISDITEQTNVLALNAAIQAASAGEAGHGFSVVAEEVQRLAERSAEATRQIGALARAIQIDTQDAVAAMEKSTQGIVEGAKLSDATGQSLREIARVSHELAQLIGSISASTHVQTDMTEEVEKAMMEIVRINEQTTVGTRLTRTSISELTELAAGLKASVSSFKL